MDYHYHLLQNQMDIFGAWVGYSLHDPFETWDSSKCLAALIQGRVLCISFA